MASSAHDDPSDDEWGEASSQGGSRYPVHDACEFEDADTLRRLIFVPQSDESSVSSDDSTSSSSTEEDNENSHAAAHAAAVGRSPVGAGVGASSGRAAFLMEQAKAVVKAAVLPFGAGGGKAPNNDDGASDANVGDDGKAADGEGGRPQSETGGAASDIANKSGTSAAADGASSDMKVDAPANEALPTDSSKLVDGDVVMLDESNASGDSLVKHVSPEVSHASQTPANGTDAQSNDVAKSDVNAASADAVAGKKAKKKPQAPKFNCPFDLDQRDDDENTPLHIAIHARKIEHVSLLLEAGASVHKKCDGSAPIHLAISIGAITAHVNFAKKCVELLSRHGADLTLRDDSFHTPLYLACVANLCSVVQMLLNDPGSKDTLNLRSDRVGGRPLHAAARCDVMRKGVPKGGERSTTELLLAAEGVDIDAQNNYGRTPLHIAASRGNWYVARLLINAGADVHLLDKRGFTPGQVAKKRGMVVPPDLMVLGEDSPTRDLIMDPDGNTLILCHELCIQHRTCPPIVRGDEGASEPPPENVRRLTVLINDDDGILRTSEFSGCKWNTEVRRAAMADVLKVHEYTYIEKTSQLCASIPDHPNAIQTLDADTTVSRWSFEAALRAAGSVCEAVDKVMSGDFRNAFCAVRPPGHHAGPRGIVTCPNDPDGSHGFCLLNNVAIGAAYARSMYRNDGIKKVAIIDFDVHHGNGTEDIVRQITPIVEQHVIRTPFAVGGLHTSSYKPWLDETDVNEVFFASTHGYGPRDREIPAGAVQGGWFYPASGKTYKSKSLTSPSEIETPNLSEFLMSQTWARLGDDYRLNCCKVIDIGLSLPAKDDTYNHGLQRLELRDSYRKNVIPALLDFNPDMIFISAGFDAHRKDTMNFGYVGMIEEDYEWLTEQLVKVANTCCNGRVVSVLEGGYKIHGGIVSPFARSVASHVRGLVDGGSSRETYDKDEGEWESQFERHMNEEKEKRRQMKMDRHARATDALRQSLLMGARHQPHVADHEEASHLDEESHNNDIGMAIGEEEPSRKRRRNQVDYKQLYEKMKQEEGGGI